MAGSLRRLIRDLRLRRGRERRGLALAEGVRLVEEALASGVGIRGAAIAPALETTARGKSLKAALEHAAIALHAMTDRELVELADTEHPQGIIAIVEPPRWAWTDLAARAGAVLVVLDGVQDPGNVGTILRTGLALGAAGMVALPGTAELHNPKVVRGSMGALFRWPAITAAGDELLRWTTENAVEVWAAEAGAEPPPPVRGGARPPIALVLGNEGAGLSPVIAQAAHRRVGIALGPGVESLNVAVAAGILLYEVTRAG